MKVFVTGATGAIGRHVVPQLVAAGHQVTALARSEEKAASLRAEGAAAVAVSLFDVDGLAAAMAGHDAVANLATAIPPVNRAIRPSAWAENDRIRTDGSAAVTEAVRRAGVGRFVQESITFTYPDRGDAWIDEDVAIEPTPAISSVAVAERNALAVGGTVLRFGAFFGAGTGHTDALLAAARRHLGMVVGRPSAYMSTIHLHDAAAAVVAALEAPPGTYNVVDDEPLPKRQVAEVLGAAVGKRPWVLLPGRLARLSGTSAAALMRSQRVCNARLRATGWSPRYPTLADALAEIVGAEELTHA